jgi:YYY domain-containing protein
MRAVVFEWLAREGWIVVSWWLLVTLAGVAAFPLCARLFSGLPDRGYTFARAVGLLLVGWVFWLLGSFGFLKNMPGSVILSWLIVIALTLVFYFRGGRVDWRLWWRENRTVVLAGELLFAVLFVGWTIVRAHQNGLTGTEKPMDLMFISSIMQSPTFPPNDGWLSGYSISYYYFGYFLAAMLSMMSGIASSIGFNVLVALLFSLTGLTAFGVVYNLVRSRAIHDPVTDVAGLSILTPSPRTAVLTGILGMVMVVLMGNFQMALIEFPFNARIASEAYLSFTATQGRAVYPERQQAREAGIPDDQPVTLSPGRSDPDQWGSWWWFRASRVLDDFNLDGTSVGAQPIDEFPQFSFLLADNHPHVMALPFVILSLGLALNLLLIGRDPNQGEILFYALCLGALIFLNTWDVLTGFMALLGADGLRRLIRGQGRLIASDWWGIIRFAITLAVLAVIFYLPFLVSFRSQAAGILPNIIWPTYFQQYFIMFGPFILLLSFFLAGEARRAERRMNWKLGLQVAGGIVAVLLSLVLLFILAAMRLPDLNAIVLQFAAPYGGFDKVIPLILQRRLDGLLTTLVLLAGIVLIVGRLFPKRPVATKDQPDSEVTVREDRIVIECPQATGFALLLAGIGILLTLVPEFVYLRDNFGTRINTIFKFYYQAWLVFSVASAYAVYTVLADVHLKSLGRVYRAAFAGVAFVAVGAGLLYPLYGIRERMFNEGAARTATGGLTLDGGPTLVTPNDYAAIRCWEASVGDERPIVLEVTGPAYNISYTSGRVSGLTGAPTLLGWENHERQWRGSTYDSIAGTRPNDIKQIYSDLRWDVVAPLIAKYGVDYIFYGDSERIAYGSAGEEKFQENLEMMCREGNSVFYRVTNTALQVAAAR